MRLIQHLIAAVAAAALFSGCAAIDGAGRRASVDRPENAYFYYTEARLAQQKGAREQAVLLLKKAIELDPASVYLKRELALEYIQQKDLANALRVLAEILSRQPDDIEALIIYGHIQQAQNQLDQASQTYEKVIALDKSQQETYLLLGGIYLQKGRDDDARRVFTELIRNFPDAYAGHFFLGKLYARQGQKQMAAKEFKKALEIEPTLLEPRFELIDLYRSEGKSDIIIRTYEDILQNNPLNIRAALELGLIYWKEGRRADAEKLFLEMGRRSTSEFDVILKVIQTYLEPDRYQDAVIVIQGLLKGSPDNPDLNHLAGIATYGLKQNDKALTYFLKVTPQSRFYPDAVVHIAFLYRDGGDTGQAVALLEKAVAENPDNAEFRYYLGTFYEEAEDYERAVATLGQAVRLDPEETRYLFRLGVAYDKGGRKQESIETMKSVIRLDPQDASALNYLGYTYADLGQNLAEAERLIQQALEIKPDDGYITDSLGWVYYKMGDYPRALTVLKRAVELVPEDPVIREHLGDAYVQANDPKNALQAYKSALKLGHKDRPAIEEKIRQLK
ncbi:MAG: tetratricopeptide repeat protein [Desulfobacterales bacterium]